MFFRKIFVALLTLILFNFNNFSFAEENEFNTSYGVSTPQEEGSGGSEGFSNKNKNIEKIYAPILFFDSKEKAPLTSVENYVKTGLSLVAYKNGKKYKIIKRKLKLDDMEKYPSKFIFINNTTCNPKFKCFDSFTLITKYL